MIRDIADAVETLEEAGARFYSITGAGTHIAYEPDNDNATSDDAIARFQKDWGKLGPGIYTVNYKKSKTDTRAKTSFRINKSPEFVGNPGGMGGGYDGMITQLQIQLEQMKHAQEMADVKRRYEDEIRQLKEQSEAGTGPEKFLQYVGQINQLYANAKGGNVAALPAASANVAGAASDELSEVAQSTVEAIYAALGNSEPATLNALRKIGALARNNPAQIQQVIAML
ncbi:hypothetical protein HER32_00265 [Hymenobacter sp. BT18]|uniref:hypothetical protein n=1 Tax=Hymenobacter sp. BT18 TaxID=2835648 RepID=UPI00143E7D70|nr:hypothetical protein [Hymenobacter sp. BT18]QIX59709.1 hypothetical protein HER32_00265 [Hymenobacter sp. BT18]